MPRTRVTIPDAFHRLAGRVPDRLVADACATSVQTVSRWRRLCGIPPTVRSGAGAPRVDGGAAGSITVNLSPDLKREATRQAAAAGLSTSAWTRRLIEWAVAP